MPLLLIHGFEVDLHVMLPLESALHDSACERVYLDLPGFGGSPAGPEIDSADAVVEAVVAFVTAELADGPFAVIGSSFGGKIARAVTGRFRDRVRGLGLLCPQVDVAGARDVPPKTELQADPDLVASLDPEEAADFVEVAVRQTPQAWQAHRSAVLPGLRAHDRAAVARIAARYALTRQPEQDAPPLDVPAFLVTGRQDHVVGHRDQLALLPRYPRMTYAVLDDAGHNAHLDRPELVDAIVRDWLQRMAV